MEKRAGTSDKQLLNQQNGKTEQLNYDTQVIEFKDDSKVMKIAVTLTNIIVVWIRSDSRDYLLFLSYKNAITKLEKSYDLLCQVTDFDITRTEQNEAPFCMVQEGKLKT